MSARLARERATENLIKNLLPQVNFIEPPSASVLCLLCNQVLKNPMQLSCGHRVCKSCDESFIADANGERHCPNDGEQIERTFPDNSALTEIMNLDCFCLCSEEGCTWQGLLLDLEVHVTICEFCVELVCPYHVFQCNFTGTRKKLEKHVGEDVMKHDCLLATCLRDCLDDVAQNRVMMNTIKEGGSNVNKAFVQLTKQISTLEKTLQENCSIVDNQNTFRGLKEQYKVFEQLISRGEKKKKHFVAFHAKFEELLQNVDNQMKSINNSQRNNDSNDFLSANKKPLIDKVKRLGEFNESHGKQINEVGIKIRIAQCSNNDGNYTWKLDNLTKRFTEGANGELYTPPLYTSNFGYKYSAKVILGGDKSKGGGNANHMAFYIVIMQGDYDEILHFPFPYPIEVTLVNVGNKQDITHTLYPDPNKVHFQKPFKNMNPAIGFSRFCSHEKLNTGGFIKNDTIYFRIIVRKAGINVKEPNI